MTSQIRVDHTFAILARAPGGGLIMLEGDYLTLTLLVSV